MSVTCVLCGGTDFYKEAGIYFCSDCQTQTQDIQEHVFEDQTIEREHDEPPRQTPKKKAARKAKSAKSTKDEERLTSWECYNYILLGLVNELIELGADESLRTTVEVLWFHYLKKIEVIRDGNLPPKLPAVNVDRDAAIIYGRTRGVKRPRSRSRSVGSTTDASTMDKESLKRERTKQKRALARSEYNDYLSSTQQSDASLVNQSLLSLKSQSSSNTDSKILQYNKSAEHYLKKLMKNGHLKRHCEDVNSILDCHQKFTRRNAGTYYVDPSLLSRSKLFSILYLGLLINKDKIQLGDMLRFIREGHLSFQHIDHFFPEESIEKKLNVCSFTKGPIFMTHSLIRTYAAKMISLLSIKKYVPIQNIVELCERYCKELNLPNCIQQFILNVISRTLPKFPISSMLPLPNYEARTIAFIIFVLKLLFGLDDATEYEMSKLSSLINEHLIDTSIVMFNFKTWLKYLGYRHLVLSQVNFGASYNESSFDETKEFVDHLEKYCEKRQITDEDDGEIEIFKRLLNKMGKIWEPNEEGLIFKPSLIPYNDYAQLLLDTNQNIADKKLLRKDFTNTSLDFIFYAELYLKKIFPSSQVVYKHGGKNEDIQFMYLFDEYKRYREKSREAKSLFNVTLLSEQNLSKFPNFFKETQPKEDIKIKRDSRDLVDKFQDSISNKVKRNAKRREKLFRNVDLVLNVRRNHEENIDQTKKLVYEPSEQFCANLQNVTLYNEEKWEKFYATFSLSFRIILKECARITEQSTKDVYLEYLKVETYLTYILDIGKDRPYKENIVNADLRNTIQQTLKMW